MLQDRGSSACGLGEEVALGSCAKAQDWQAAVSLLFEEGASENERVDGSRPTDCPRHPRISV